MTKDKIPFLQKPEARGSKGSWQVRSVLQHLLEATVPAHRAPVHVHLKAEASDDLTYNCLGFLEMDLRYKCKSNVFLKGREVRPARGSDSGCSIVTHIFLDPPSFLLHILT